MEYVVTSERLTKAKKVIAERVKLMDFEELRVFTEAVEWDHKVVWTGEGSDIRPRFHLNDLEVVMLAAGLAAATENAMKLRSNIVINDGIMEAMDGDGTSDGGSEYGEPQDGEEWEGVRRGQDAEAADIPF